MVTFDPSILHRIALLEVFFTCHDPTQLNRQGNDIGPHYRSAVFYSDDRQRDDVQSVIDGLKDAFYDDIVTEVSPLENFYEAHKYHHDYIENKPTNPNCMMVVAPKIAKTRAKHAHLYE